MKFLKSLFGGGPEKLEERGDELRLDFSYREAAHFYQRALEALREDPQGTERLTRKVRDVRRSAVAQLLEEATELVRSRQFDLSREKLETARLFSDADSAREEVDRRLAELTEVEAIEALAAERQEAVEGEDHRYELALEAMSEDDRRRAEEMGGDFRAAYEAFQSEAWDDARRHLDALLADRPEDPFLLELAAGVAEHAGDDARARTLYERTRELEPLRPAAVLGLAALHGKEGRVEEARRLLGEAATRVPVTTGLSDPWVEVHEEHAMALAASGQPGAAADILATLLDAKVGDPGTLYYNLAGMLETMGQLAEGRRALERAIQAAPRRALYLERMADVLVKEGKRLDEALSFLVSANDVETSSGSGVVAEGARLHRISPRRARYLYKMARIYFLKGEDREAERLITTALAISRDASVTRALEDLRQEMKAPPPAPTS